MRAAFAFNILQHPLCYSFELDFRLRKFCWQNSRVLRHTDSQSTFQTAQMRWQLQGKIVLRVELVGTAYILPYLKQNKILQIQ